MKGMGMDVTPVIQSITFRTDGIVEVSFVEQHEQTDQMVLVRVLMFGEDEGGPLLEQAKEAILDLLDGMLVKLRNPAFK